MCKVEKKSRVLQNSLPPIQVETDVTEQCCAGILRLIQNKENESLENQSFHGKMEWFLY